MVQWLKVLHIVFLNYVKTIDQDIKLKYVYKLIPYYWKFQYSIIL